MITLFLSVWERNSFFLIYRDDPVYIYIWHFLSTILIKKRRKSEHCNSVIHCNSQYGHSYSGSNSLYYNIISSWRISFRSAALVWIETVALQMYRTIMLTTVLWCVTLADCSSGTYVYWLDHFILVGSVDFWPSGSGSYL